LGYIPLGTGIVNHSLDIVAEPSAASGAGHELDIDYVIIHGVDDSANALYFPQIDLSDGVRSLHQLDSKLTPSVSEGTFTPTTFSGKPAYEGSAFFAADGSLISIFVFGLDTTTGTWVIRNSADSAEVNFTLTARQQLGYLTPL
jgi:hypothetical protein